MDGFRKHIFIVREGVPRASGSMIRAVCENMEEAVDIIALRKIAEVKHNTEALRDWSTRGMPISSFEPYMENLIVTKMPVNSYLTSPGDYAAPEKVPFEALSEERKHEMATACLGYETAFGEPENVRTPLKASGTRKTLFVSERVYAQDRANREMEMIQKSGMTPLVIPTANGADGKTSATAYLERLILLKQNAQKSGPQPSKTTVDSNHNPDARDKPES